MLINIFRCSSFYQRLNIIRTVSKTHQPLTFEENWTKIFENATTNGYLPTRQNTDNQEKAFVMLFPPPNVTGTLHLGHALTTSVHDCLLRWNIMQGKSYIRCVPGYDHAGIATQVIVEKHIAPTTREQLGREKFLQECHRWSSTYRRTIESQLKRLGPLFDWSNAYFTMDENLLNVVRDSFLELFEKGLIYRDRRIVNWCCQLQSVVSDIEVDSKEIVGREKILIPTYGKSVEFGVLYKIAYKIVNCDKPSEILVCTTRPETILGDTAIAVHPDDERYRALKDRFVENPFDPNDRLPIIFDESVDKTFGTGAVKVTPGHDTFDYNLSLKHKLPIRTVLNNHGRIILSSDHPCFNQLNNLHRYDAREKILQLLDEQKLRRGEQEQQRMVIPICSRTGDVIEPMVKEQWFLNTTEMSRQAISVVEQNNLKFTPESTEKVWKYWLKNVRPWCLSRQLWWGHSIPMYRCWLKDKPEEYEWIGAKTIEEAREKAAKKFENIKQQSIEIEQDQDVLDTWFSSGLLPISIFCNNTIKNEYPTTLLETGYDIMFFWVARMVMLSLELKKELPFHEVLFHGLICDPNGKKMSKSLGNIIDPMDVINGVQLSTLENRLDQSHLARSEIERAKRIQKIQFPNGIESIGSDGLRLSLLSHDISQQAIRLDPVQFDSVARYCNKFWNAYKYVTEFALVGFNFRDLDESSFRDEQIQSFVQNRLIDRWMFNQFNRTIVKVNDSMKSYSFHTAIVRLRDSFLKDFCDFYIEFSKIPLKHRHDVDQHQKRQIQSFLYYLMKNYLIIYHPLLPSLTEELWHDFTGGKKSFLIHQKYPQAKPFDDVQHSFDDNVLNVVRLIGKNSAFFRLNLRLLRDIDLIVDISRIQNVEFSSAIEQFLLELRTTTRFEKLRFQRQSRDDHFNKFYFRDRLNDDVDLIFNLNENKETLVLIEKLRKRLGTQIEKYRKDLEQNERSIEIHEQVNDLQNLQRERRRRENLLEDLLIAERRFNEFQRFDLK